MATLSPTRLQEQQQRITAYQAQYDRALEPYGRRAPAPILGQSARAYCNAAFTASQAFLETNSPYREVQAHTLDGATFRVIEQQMFAALANAARQVNFGARVPSLGAPDRVSPGLREVTTVNPENGHKTHSFYGDESFVRSMGRPGRRVTSFFCSALGGHVDASGRPLR
jgi:hypothetical protein